MSCWKRLGSNGAKAILTAWSLMKIAEKMLQGFLFQHFSDDVLVSFQKVVWDIQI